MPWLDDVGLTQLWSGLKTRFARIVHKHGQADIDGLESALAGKAPTSHSHSQAQVTGLESALAGKAPTSHGHTQAQVTGLDAALAGKAASSHSHNQTQVVGLVEALELRRTRVGFDDRRNVATTPNDYNQYLINQGIKSGSTIGLPGSWWYIIGYRGYSDSTGGPAHELAFGEGGVIMHRFGSTTSWDAWKKLYQEGDGLIKQVGYTMITIPATGWLYDGTYDRYYQVFDISPTPVYCNINIVSVTGANFPIIGAEVFETTKLRVFMADVPTVSALTTFRFSLAQ